ncbi:MAG: UDP-glucose/GDP-mannose dehydrogenase family protein [Methanomassiliicoccales archaeon]
MKISVLGAGYVGLITGVCLADLGHEVVCIDVVPEKVARINMGMSTLFEEGFEEKLRRLLAEHRFRASMDPAEISTSDITFICVGTPSQQDGTLDLKYVRQASRMIGEALALKDRHHTIVVKSTVMPGTCDDVVAPELERASKKCIGKDIGLCMNPEFLKEGTAIFDFMHPDRIIIGGNDDRAIQEVKDLYEPFNCPKMEVSLITAEMIKIAANSFLATKISFANEMGNLCKQMGVDFRQVAEGIGYDARIGRSFLRAGCGFGGSCFPKDVKGIAAEAKRRGLNTTLLDATLEVNRRQPLIMLDLLEKHMSPGDKTIAVLGLTFKPNTDDVRDASSIMIVGELLKRGARVRAYDPKGMDNFRAVFPEITYCSSVNDCLNSADAVMIITEWTEFSAPEQYGEKLVIDGRGITRTNSYDGICW